MTIKILPIGLLVILLLACESKTSSEATAVPLADEPLPANIPLKYFKLKKVLEPFFDPMGEPEPHDWLFSFKEDGQTFEQYVSGQPTLPTEERGKIYLQQIGKFTAEDRKVVKLTAEYMQMFFDLPVEIRPEMKFSEPLSLGDYRIHPEWKIKQIRTPVIFSKKSFCPRFPPTRRH